MHAPALVQPMLGRARQPTKLVTPTHLLPAPNAASTPRAPDVPNEVISFFA